MLAVFTCRQQTKTPLVYRKEKEKSALRPLPQSLAFTLSPRNSNAETAHFWHLLLLAQLETPCAAMALLCFSSYDFGSCLATLLLLSVHTHLGKSVLIVRNHMNRHHNGRPVLRTNQSACALFTGNWVRDQSAPIYQPTQCSVVDPQFDCKRFGRPDTDYLMYRWQPLNCDLLR